MCYCSVMKSTTLLVMRHAKSDWNASHGSDFDRVLSGRGISDAPRMGQWIVDQSYTPDQIICSPAQRVRETILAAGKAWDQDEDQIKWDHDIYNADLDKLLAIVAGDLKQGSINLLTGHNPGVSELILYLSGDRVPEQASDNLMPTAAVTILKLANSDNPVNYGDWQIIDYMKPRLLSESL